MLKKQITRIRGASAGIFLLPQCISQTVVPNPTLGLLHWTYLGALLRTLYPLIPSQCQCITFLG